MNNELSCPRVLESDKSERFMWRSEGRTPFSPQLGGAGSAEDPVGFLSPDPIKS